jgi:hypothetical protein
LGVEVFFQLRVNLGQGWVGVGLEGSNGVSKEGRGTSYGGGFMGPFRFTGLLASESRGNSRVLLDFLFSQS